MPPGRWWEDAGHVFFVLIGVYFFFLVVPWAAVPLYVWLSTAFVGLGAANFLVAFGSRLALRDLRAGRAVRDVYWVEGVGCFVPLLALVAALVRAGIPAHTGAWWVAASLVFVTLAGSFRIWRRTLTPRTLALEEVFE
jgi:hypothetical protein